MDYKPTLYSALTVSWLLIYVEMPSGTGKTVSLLSLIISYQQVSPFQHSIPLPLSPKLNFSSITILAVLPDPPQTDLLLSNGPGDREGSLGTQEVDGVQETDGLRGCKLQRDRAQ